MLINTCKCIGKWTVTQGEKKGGEARETMCRRRITTCNKRDDARLSVDRVSIRSSGYRPKITSDKLRWEHTRDRQIGFSQWHAKWSIHGVSFTIRLRNAVLSPRKTREWTWSTWIFSSDNLFFDTEDSSKF